MKNRKILLVITLALMSVLLVSCQKKTEAPNTTGAPQTTTQTPRTTTQAPTTTTQAPITTTQAPGTTTQAPVTTTTSENEEFDSKTLKFLMIGNSHSDDTNEWAWYIAKDLGYENVTIGTMFIPGCTVQVHANNAVNNSPAYEFRTTTTGPLETRYNTTIDYAVKYTDWDFISFQQLSTFAGLSDKCDENLDVLLNYVKERTTNPNVKFVWNMTWPYLEGNEEIKNFYQNSTVLMYSSVVSVCQEKIVNNYDFYKINPNGTAVMNLCSFYPYEVVYRDTLHMSQNVGRYLAGLMMMATITGKSIDNVKFKTEGMSDEMQKKIILSVNEALKNPFKTINSSSSEVYKITGKITDNNNSPLAGVHIYHSGTLLATTEENGDFTTNILKPNQEYELVLDKFGYEKETFTIEENDFSNKVLTINKTLTKSNITVDLADYKYVVDFGNPRFSAYVKRNENDITFVFTGNEGSLDSISGYGLWTFISTSIPASSRFTDSDSYGFQIVGKDSSKLYIENLGGQNNVPCEGLGFSLTEVSGDLCVVLTIPYAFFNQKQGANITKDSIVGFSFATEIISGQYSYGFDYNDGKTNEFKNVDDPRTYLRIDGSNNLFNSNTNSIQEEININFDANEYTEITTFGNPKFVSYVKRDSSAIYFAYIGKAHSLDSVAACGLWTFISTYEPTTSRFTDQNAYTFMIRSKSKSNLLIESPGGNNSPTLVDLSVEESGESLIAILRIPYAFFNQKYGSNITEDSIIGVSFATEIYANAYSYGFDYNDGVTNEYKNVDDPTTYLRIDKNCRLFNSSTNEPMNQIQYEVFNNATLDSFPTLVKGWNNVKLSYDGITIDTMVFLPESYDGVKEYPILTYLHGDGERGLSAFGVLCSNCALPAQQAESNIKETIIFIPATPVSWITTDRDRNGGSGPFPSYNYSEVVESKQLTGSIAMLNKLMEVLKVDTDRVYLSGYSRGAFASYYLLAKYPSVITAAVVCAGIGPKDKVETFKDIPIYVFHGDRDDVVSYADDHEMFEEYTSLGGEGVFKTCVNGDHGIVSYMKAEDFITWLYSKSKS